MSDDGNDEKAPAKIDRAVQFRLPRPEAILTARGVDQGIRREIIARPRGRSWLHVCVKLASNDQPVR